MVSGVHKYKIHMNGIFYNENISLNIFENEKMKHEPTLHFMTPHQRTPDLC
jgi:hypothetical protein